MSTPVVGERTRARVARLVLAGLVVLGGAAAHRAAHGSPAAEVGFAYVTVACLLTWAGALAYGDGVRLWTLVGRPPHDRRAWAWVGLAVPLLAFGATALVGALYVLSWIAPAFVTRELLSPDPPSILAGHPVYAALDAVATTVLGPVAEEVLFRGALLRRWSARWGPHRGMVASAALFAAFHADPFGAFAFGVCMALLARRTGTLLVPVGTHVVYNALAKAGELLAPGGEPGGTLAEFRAEAWGLALAVVPAALVLTWFIRRLGGREVSPILPAA